MVAGDHTALDPAARRARPQRHTAGACRKVSKKAEEVQLVDSRRAHNICIELSGVHLDVAVIRAALTSMRTDHLSVDALGVLQRAVPTEHEAADIRLFLAGKHPRYRGMSDANTLGACERCASRLPVLCLLCAVHVTGGHRLSGIPVDKYEVSRMKPERWFRACFRKERGTGGLGLQAVRRRVHVQVLHACDGRAAARGAARLRGVHAQL